MNTIKCLCGRTEAVAVEGMTITIRCTFCQTTIGTFPPKRPDLRVIPGGKE